MLFARTGLTRLYVVIAVIEIFLGLGICLFQEEFTSPVYQHFGSRLSLVAAILVASGAGILLQLRFRMPTVVRRWLAPLLAVPFVVLALGLGFASLWTATTFYGLLAVGLLVIPWLHVGAHDTGFDLGRICLAMIESIIGTLMLVRSELFATPGYAALHGWIPAVGMLSLIGAVSLFIGEWRGIRDRSIRTAAAGLPLVMAYNGLLVGAWTGAVGWGTVLVATLAGPLFRRIAQNSTLPELQFGDSLVQIERTIETWSWLVALAVVMFTGLNRTGTFASSLMAMAFVVLTVGYNVVMHWVLPRVGALSTRIYWHLSFLSVSFGLLLGGTGPVDAVFLMLLMALPPLAARVGGLATGLRVLSLAMAVTVVSELVDAALMDASLPMALSIGSLKAMVLAAAAMLGTRSAAAQRGLVQDLAKTRVALHDQVEQLQAQGEELLVQQEELQELNEELLHQSQTLLEQRDQLEAALEAVRKGEASRSRLIALLEATTDFVAIAGPDHRILYYNRAARQMLGIGLHEEIGEIQMPDTHPAWVNDLLAREAMPRLLRTGVWSGETALLSRSGQEIPLSQVILAHKAPDGTVEYLSTIARDISERKRFEEDLRQLAECDPLTSLYNRRRFQKELERELQAASLERSSGSVFFLDLDEFKYVNDGLGHAAGDRLLQSIASILSERVPQPGMVARLGGDEFAVLLPESSHEQAKRIAGDVLEAIANHRTLFGSQQINVTASIGISRYPSHGTTVDELLSRADVALYQAKDNGRNAYSIYTPDRRWQSHMESRLAWEQRIREALQNDWFIFVGQPVLETATGKIRQYELLLRMRGPGGELITPTSFLGIAERFGLIHAIDRWAVRTAIRTLEKFQRAGKQMKLAVNLSGKAFSDQELLPLIQRELIETQVDPSGLILEITETAAITDSNQARRFIETLKHHGCQFAIDDFGAGFSSFSQLKNLPVNYLKIDGSFVSNLPNSPVDQHLVKAVVEMARGLGKKTVAEFVGDEETLALLREFGVDYAQGYYIGHPGPLPLH